VDLREAAELLGTSTEAVGKRAVGESLRAEEIQRRDLIIRQLTQANAALAARVPELRPLRQAKMVLKSLRRVR
jgi:hypothetical protein